MKTVQMLLDKKNTKAKARFLVRSFSDLTQALTEKFAEDDKRNKAFVAVLEAWVKYLSLPWWKRAFTRKPR